MSFHVACQRTIRWKYGVFWQKETPVCPVEHTNGYRNVGDETQSLRGHSAISRDSELAHFLVEVAAFESQVLSCAGDLTVAISEPLLDDLFLEGFEKGIKTTRGWNPLPHGNHCFLCAR